MYTVRTERDVVDNDVTIFLANVFAIVLSPVRLSSVTLVRPTKAVQIFGNISTALGTLAIR